ncbi:glutamate receptor 2.9-like [Abrus precatorius]|uniref:Glutamate receptor n=1 Tax=Abrus precatorius TaxID=3816 RepID=A0A8B8KY89_ABRPR|nr:glutamate receptor 2.9-like [Abrus precatorius]
MDPEPGSHVFDSLMSSPSIFWSKTSNVCHFLPPLIFFFSLFHVGAEATNNQNVVAIGAILNLSSRAGKEEKVAIELAARNYNGSSKYHKLSLHFDDSRGIAIRAFSIAEEMIRMKKVQVIIGGLSWQEAVLVAEVGSQAQVPVISFAAPVTTPLLSSFHWPFLVLMANNSTAFVKCVADVVHAYNWQRVTVIYEEDAYGNAYGMLAFLSEALQNVGSQIELSLALPPYSYSSVAHPGGEVQLELLKLLNTQSRVFIVLQSSIPMVTCLFAEAQKMGLVDRETAWIVPESITYMLDSVADSVISSMEGVLGIKTYSLQNSTEYQSFHVQFRKSFQKENPEDDPRPGFYALQAYDSIGVVTRAMETLRNDISSPKIFLKEMLSCNFLGLSGKIEFEHGQALPSPIFRIVNVIGKSYKEIDFWTEEYGFSKTLSFELAGQNAIEGLAGPVIWPGNLMRPPRGWSMPTSAKPMKIGVPRKTPFEKFVKVENNEYSNQTKYSGFCIEIFQKIIDLLQYDLPYEIVPFNGTYTDLVFLVYNKTFDAVVGDLTIVADRMQYVDFTLPYAESGLSMIVPAKSEDTTLIFMKPFTWEMWIVIVSVLIYTMLTVWYLERDSNPEFSGPWKTQISIALWFTVFSLFFAHREKIYNNFTRMVIVVWLFLGLILTSSYTANLSSMLTVQQLQPNVKNIESLKWSNSKIGFSGDPFVRKYLESVLHFKSQNIIKVSREYNYTEEFKSKRIAAAFIEIPYEKVFMSKNCRGYSAFTPTNRFGGLGFMFQKGSPITRDFSKGILQLSENGDLKSLEDKWLNNPDECSTNITTNANGSLKLQSFWVLFAVSVFTSTFCVIISMVLSMKNNEQYQQAFEGDCGCSAVETVWKKVLILANYIYYTESSKQSQALNSAHIEGVEEFSLELQQGSTSNTLDQN